MDAVRLLTDRYRLLDRLGAGGMSVVWRAYDEVLGRDVAVKMLSGSYAADAASRDLIRYEAQAAGRLSHPHVTSVYDYGEAVEPDGTRLPFVVMELVNGVTLDARLSGGPLRWRVAVRVAAEVAAALAAAHARGLVHRDIKPANVMLTPTGVKVVDFGIAALAGADADSTPTVLGTPAYLAPERLGGQAVTPASDVYALGLLLFRMLIGRLPWRADTATQMIEAHCYTEPQPLPAIDGLPAEVATLCARSLAKRPEDRPSAEEAARILAAAADIRVPLPLDDALAWDSTSSADGATQVIVAGTGNAVPAARGGRRLRSRRAVVAAGAAVAVTATGLATWSTVGGETEATAQAAAVRPQAAATPPISCEVRYQTKKDEAGTFSVDVAVVNSGAHPADDWKMRFEFPADQRLTGGTGAEWTQSGRTVTARGDGPLAPGATATLTMTGGYQESNPIPTTFSLNDAACRATITGAAMVPVALTAPQAPAAAPAPAAAGGTGGGSGTGTGTGMRNGQQLPQQLQQLRDRLAKQTEAAKAAKAAKGKGTKGAKG
ncbi:serine/threonine-protein kinase [Planosporangium sp. 12N6]|uniref:serine/threonine-protein kinase n=1 Tax=Planosporangium spinosum TaxID=3402278 RepID=UPI003CE9A516